MQCPFCDEQLEEIKSIETRWCGRPFSNRCVLIAALSTGINRQVNLWIFMRIYPSDFKQVEGLASWSVQLDSPGTALTVGGWIRPGGQN